MTKKTKKCSRKLLNELCDDCEKDYCYLKEIILMSHVYDERFLTQVKAIEIFKYERSEKEEHDIGWEDAIMMWVDGGWAKKFSEVFDECEDDPHPKIIYKEIKKRLKTHK